MDPLMLFMCYSPRPDSEHRGYADWLRQIDNPFFTRQAHVSGYSNWRIEPSAAHDLSFSHFDFLDLEPGSAPFDVLAVPEVQQFIGEWTRLWGRNPGGLAADNCHCYVASAQGGRGRRESARVSMTFDPADRTAEQWRIVEALVGEAPFRTFERQFLQDDQIRHPGVLAERIAP